MKTRRLQVRGILAAICLSALLACGERHQVKNMRQVGGATVETTSNSVTQSSDASPQSSSASAPVPIDGLTLPQSTELPAEILVSFTVNGSATDLTVNPGADLTVQWNAPGASSCYTSRLGMLPPSGSTVIASVTSSLSLSLLCAGAITAAPKTILVTVTQAAPAPAPGSAPAPGPAPAPAPINPVYTINGSTTNLTVASGTDLLFSWDAGTAASCSLAGQSNLPGKGTLTIKAGTLTATYPLYCSGATTKSITVSIAAPPAPPAPAPAPAPVLIDPIFTINGSPTDLVGVVAATPLLLSWDAGTSSGCSLAGQTNLPAKGTLTVTFGNQDQIFTLNCAGAKSKSITVFYALPEPTPLILLTGDGFGNPVAVKRGSQVKLSWTGKNVDQCAGPFGVFGVSNTLTTPAVMDTTVYSVTCDQLKTGKSVTASIKLWPKPDPAMEIFTSAPEFQYGSVMWWYYWGSPRTIRVPLYLRVWNPNGSDYDPLTDLVQWSSSDPSHPIQYEPGRAVTPMSGAAYINLSYSNSIGRKIVITATYRGVTTTKKFLAEAYTGAFTTSLEFYGGDANGLIIASWDNTYMARLQLVDNGGKIAGGVYDFGTPYIQAYFDPSFKFGMMFNYSGPCLDKPKDFPIKIKSNLSNSQATTTATLRLMPSPIHGEIKMCAANTSKSYDVCEGYTVLESPVVPTTIKKGEVFNIRALTGAARTFGVSHPGYWTLLRRSDMSPIAGVIAATQTGEIALDTNLLPLGGYKLVYKTEQCTAFGYELKREFSIDIAP